MNNMTWQKTKLSSCETFHLLDNKPLYFQRFKRVMKYHEPGLALAQDASGAFHINQKGEPIYSHRFIEAFGFYEGLAAVKSQKGCFHITSDGRACYAEYYAWCGNFQEERCSVRDKNSQYFHIDSQGKRVYIASYAYTGDYKDGIAVVCNVDGLHTHIDVQGQLLHKKWFLALDVFHKGYACAKDHRGWFHIDKSAQPLYRQRYQRIEPFYNGIAHVETFSGELILIDTEGKKIKQLRLPLQKPWQQLSADMVGFWRTETIAAAVHLHVLDYLPGSISTIAQKAKLLPKHLTRLLRALWELNLIDCSQNTWYLTEKGQWLVPYHESFLAAAAIMWSDVNGQQWKSLTNLLQENEFSRPRPHFKVKASAKKQALYHQAIDGYAAQDFFSCIKSINWQQHQQLIGIGRSAKVLLESILEHYDYLQALLLGEAYLFKSMTIASTLASRYILQPHNLLEPWPQSADAILFPRFLHYFSDQDALKILQRARDALLPQGKIYVIEMLLEEENPQGGLLDLNMWIESGGQLRSLTAWETLSERAFLRLKINKKLESGINLLVLGLL